MSEETAVVEQQPAAPSLAEAYEAGHDNNSGVEGKRKPEPRSERNTRISQEEDTAREIGETSRRTEHAKPKREQSLTEAYEGIEPEAAEQFTLPEGFASYDAADIEACLGLMGLSESDMQRPELAAMVLKELEASFQPQEGAEEEGESEDETEESEEKKPDEQKPEVKDESKKASLPSKLEELSPEQRVEMQKHVEQVWTRAQEVNHPAYTEHFTKSLAGILGTPPEQMETLHHTVQALQFGAQNLMETALPALVHAYLQQNFAGVMETYAPGFAANYTSDVLTRTWDSVRGDDLPAFSTEPDSEFQKLAAEVRTKHPFLDNLDFKDASGKPLPMMAALKAKAALTAKLCRGERATPKAMQDAVAEALATGKRSAEHSNRRVSAGRALGKGRTTGSIGKPESSGTSLQEAYSAVHNREGGI